MVTGYCLMEVLPVIWGRKEGVDEDTMMRKELCWLQLAFTQEAQCLAPLRLPLWGKGDPAGRPYGHITDKARYYLHPSPVSNASTFQSGLPLGSRSK